jgi:hypothetical protein
MLADGHQKQRGHERENDKLHNKQKRFTVPDVWPPAKKTIPEDNEMAFRYPRACTSPLG